MTAQINDIFRHRDEDFALAGISEGDLFDPALLELEPTSTCTACWRGYQAIFAVSDGHLVLDTLHINLACPDGSNARLEGPIINGAAPTGPDARFDLFNNHYVGINYHLEYSGGLLLAAGFIRELYVHMGFHPPWKYRRVIELVFENGILRKEVDRSSQMAELRTKVRESTERADSPDAASLEEIRNFVERSFDRRYRLL